MSSEDYRYYHQDGAGRMDAAEWISAVNDEQAVEQVGPFTQRRSVKSGKARGWSRNCSRPASARTTPTYKRMLRNA